jgi:hypothetical protein
MVARSLDSTGAIKMAENSEPNERNAAQVPPSIDWTTIFERATGSIDTPISSQTLQLLVSNLEDISPPEAQFAVQNAWEDGELLRVTVDLTETWFEHYYFLLPEPSDKGHEGVFIPSMIFWSDVAEDGTWSNPNPTRPAESISKPNLEHRLITAFESQMDPMLGCISTEEIAHRIVEHIDLFAPAHITDDGIVIDAEYENILTLVGLADRCLQATRDIEQDEAEELADRVREATKIYYNERYN